MKLRETIKSDIKKAMIGRNKVRTSLLRTLIGEIDRDMERRVSDEFVISIIKKMIKNAKIMGNEDEIEILSEYTPSVLTKDEILDIVKEMVKNETYTPKDMGSFMKAIKIKYGQSMDMKIASTEFRNLI